MEWPLPESERIYLRELARKQAAYAALSRLHWYVTDASVSVNEKDADFTVVGLTGLAVMVGGAT